MNDLSLYILDLVENSINAHASVIEVTARENRAENLLELTIRDNGIGMDETTQKKALDPFYTTRKTRRVGLGLPFIKMATEDALGSFSLQSVPGEGTLVVARFSADHVNTPPLGDLAATLYAISVHQEIKEFKYHHLAGSRSFNYDLDQVKSVLDGVPLTEGKVMKFIMEYIQENIDSIRGGTQ
jgi:anti-sigma regulatory factor (Ser/Thr protein kinase)